MTRKALSVLGIVVVGMLLLFWAKSCADKNSSQPKIPPKVQRDLDSLEVTRSAHDAQKDSIRLIVIRDSVARVDAQRRATRAEVNAHESRRIADSLVAIAQDAEQWKEAHDERQREARQWQTTADEKESALQTEIHAHAQTKLALTQETIRRVHLEDITIPGLQNAIAQLERPCKIGFIPCPSRTVIGVLSAAGGFAAGHIR